MSIYQCIYVRIYIITNGCIGHWFWLCISNQLHTSGSCTLTFRNLHSSSIVNLLLTAVTVIIIILKICEALDHAEIGIPRGSGQFGHIQDGDGELATARSSEWLAWRDVCRWNADEICTNVI